MSGSRPITLGAVLLACTPAPLPEETASETTTGVPVTTTTGPASTSSSTTGPATTTGSGEPPTTGSHFIDPPDGGWGPHHGCSIWIEDCPFGQKCMPYSSDGDNAWDSLKCVTIVPDPAQLGEPCTVEGGPPSGEDTCDIHLLCWYVDPDTMTGSCIAMCVGSPEAPECADPAATCIIAGDGVLAPCLPMCDPLTQNCSEGDACIPNPGDPDAWICVLDASGDEGQAFDPCEYVNACDPGLLCVDPTVAAECDPMASGCCVPLCDVTLPNTCPGEGQECVSWYEQGQAPPGLEHVGLCTLPTP